MGCNFIVYIPPGYGEPLIDLQKYVRKEVGPLNGFVFPDNNVFFSTGFPCLVVPSTLFGDLN